MTKAIRSYPKEQQAEVVKRRLAEKTGGMGNWAAKNWPGEQEKKAPEKKKTGA